MALLLHGRFPAPRPVHSTVIGAAWATVESRMTRESYGGDLQLWRGEDHLLLRREVSNGAVVYVGYVNGVEETSTTARGDTMRLLLKAASRHPRHHEPTS